MARKLLAGLVLLAIVGMLLPDAVRAQDGSPTAVVVTPPTAEGCEDIDAYLAELQEAREASRDLWEAAYPGITFPSDMSDEAFLAFLLALSPSELNELADLYSMFAELVGDVDVPPVASAYHQARLDGAKVAASAIRDAATVGVISAFSRSTEELAAATALVNLHGQVALTVCPAFQQVLEYHANDDEGTPEAG
jgi:hypothetical protein